MGEDRKKRTYRDKNDVLIKYYQIQQFVNLSCEEVGILVQALIIEQDTENKRYSKMPEIVKPIIEEHEKEIMQKFHSLMETNLTAVQAYAALSGQVQNSKEAFNKVVNFEAREELPEPSEPAQIEYWSEQDLTEEDLEGATDEQIRLFKRHISKEPKTLSKFDALCDIIAHENEYLEQEYIESLEANIPSDEEELPFS